MTVQNLKWLASYPKSGNTWVRCFLRAYQFDAFEPINVNLVGRISMSDSRKEYFEEARGTGDQQFTDSEINALRADVQHRIAKELGKHQVVKTHNARVAVDGVPVIQDELTMRAVYIVRNPLDVVDSLADHTGATIDQAIRSMNDWQFCFGGSDKKFVRQYLTTWSNHVRTWTVAPPFPVLIIRYEDMLASPEDPFTKLIHFLGWMYDRQRLLRAVRFSSFEVLQATEKQTGFQELSDNSRSQTFFRRGRSASWEGVLTQEQRSQIIEDHADMMRKLGYLPD